MGRMLVPTMACALLFGSVHSAFAEADRPATPVPAPAPPAAQPPGVSAPAPTPAPPTTPAAPYGYPPPYPYPYPYAYPYAPPVYPPPPPPPPPPLTSVSITLSPLHGLMGLLELSVEFRVGERVGIAAIGGAGNVKASTGERFSAYELGGQFRYYVTGNFRRGLHLGTEVLYLNVSGNMGEVAGMADGLALGPLVGWKTTLEGGFTFEVQGGIQFLTVGAEATDGTRTATGSASEVIPLLNLNLGWSI